jgi:GTP diphosphokinase / guanosine-3',5'-bis(diphosphate) 3'-diphosphatase
LRRTIELLAEGSNPEEFLEHTKLELFHDQVFCFTPKGKLIALPRHANVIDFAYAVHTDVGNMAVGCKINGKIAPLVSELTNGDEVEIITSRGQTTPPAAWESLVTTGKARAAIRRATRAAVRNQYAGLGRRIVERLCQRAKMVYSDEKLQGALPRLARASVDEVMSAVGRGEMRAADVVRAMYPDYKEERAAIIAQQPKPESGWFGLKKAKSVKARVPGETGAAIPIRGINTDLPVRFAPNGGAVPGDRIVGILTPGEGITIYPIQSPALKDFEDVPERWLDLRWDVEERTPQRFPGAYCAADRQRAGLARPGRAGHRRARRQHRQYQHGALVARFHLGDHRPRGVRHQAPQLDHRAIAREGCCRARRAGERVKRG